MSHSDVDRIGTCVPVIAIRTPSTSAARAFPGSPSPARASYIQQVSQRRQSTRRVRAYTEISGGAAASFLRGAQSLPLEQAFCAVKQRGRMNKYGKFAILMAIIVGSLGFLAYYGIQGNETYYKTITELRQMGDSAQSPARPRRRRCRRQLDRPRGRRG